MDEKLLGALNNLSDALSHIAEILEQKSSNKDSDVSKTLVSGNFVEQINGISEGVKSIKSDTTKILSNQDTLLTMAKTKGDKGDKDDLASKVGGDGKKQSMIKDGLTTILLMGVAVVALGAAFGMIGDVDFGSVIALSIAIPMISLSLMKVAQTSKEIGFNPLKDGFGLVLTITAISLAVVASSYLLGMVQTVGPAQLLTTIFIAGVFSVIGFSLGKILGSFKGLSVGDSIIASILMPLIFPAISLAIAGSSYILNKVQPVGTIQLLTSLAISLLFVPLGFAAGLLLKSFKDIDPDTAVITMVTVPFVMLGMSMAVQKSSEYISKVNDISLMQFITSIAISILFIPLAFAAGLLVKMSKGIDFKDVATLPLLLTTMSLAVMLSSHVLAQTQEIEYSKMLNILATGVTVAVMGVILGGAMVLMSKIGKPQDYFMGGLAVLIVSGAISLSSHILGMGNYGTYPSPEWTGSVGLSMLAFGLPILGLGIAILATSGLGALAIVAGAGATLVVAGTIAESSHILATGNYGNFPSIEWSASMGLSLLAFAPAVVLLGTLSAIPFVGGSILEGGKKAVLDISKTIVESAAILATGNFSGGPKKEWAEGISLALGAFSPIYAMMMANGVMTAIFGGGVSVDEFSSAIETISKGIVSSANLFGDTKFEGGPDKEWAEGVGGAIAAFAPVYSILSANSGWFSSGVSVDDFKKAIVTISDGIIEVAGKFADKEGLFKQGPKKEWAEGVGGAIGAFSPIYDIIMNTTFSKDNLELMNTSILALARTMVRVGNIFTLNPDSFGAYPNKEWGQNVSDVITDFTTLSKKLVEEDIGFFEMRKTASIATQMARTAAIFHVNRKYFETNIDPNFIKNMGTNILDYTSLLKQLPSSGIGDIVSNLTNTDPMSNLTKGMFKIASAYDKLSESINKFGGSINGLDLEKVNAFGMMTNNIAVLSAMDSDMFDSMMDVLESRTSVFADLLKTQFEQNSSKVSVGGNSPKITTPSVVEQQNKELSEKFDAMIALLSQINSNSGNIDEHLSSKLDDRKELM